MTIAQLLRPTPCYMVTTVTCYASYYRMDTARQEQVGSQPLSSISCREVWKICFSLLLLALNLGKRTNGLLLGR